MPKWTIPKNDKYFVSAQNSCLFCYYSSNTLISEIFIKIREGAFRDVPCKKCSNLSDLDFMKKLWENM